MMRVCNLAFARLCFLSVLSAEYLQQEDGGEFEEKNIEKTIKEIEESEPQIDGANLKNTYSDATSLLMTGHKVLQPGRLMLVDEKKNNQPTAWVGCFKDDPSRDMRDGPPVKRGYTVATCREEAVKRGLKYFAMQYNGECMVADDYSTPAEKYPVKSDSECGNKCSGEAAEDDVLRCGGTWRNAVYKTAPPTWVGCFKDDSSRDMRDGPPVKRGYTVATCREEAVKRGLKYFAMQYNGECMVADDYSTPAEKYPITSDSECGNKCSGEAAEDDVLRCGGTWRNAVYTTAN